MSNNNEKITLKYRINNGYNPKTGAKIKRPFIVESEKYSIERVCKYALENNYMTGQYESCLGQAKGFLEAIKKIAAMGKVVDIASWFRVRAYLTGTVGENETLTNENEYKVRIQTLEDLKLDKSNFSFQNEGASAKVSIQSVCTVGGDNPGEWQKNKQANAVGSNLIFDEKIGDIVTWTSGDLSGEVAVDATAYNCLTMAWDSEWDEFTAGTEITLTFTLHGGNADAAPKTFIKTVKVIVG